jgi:predicted nucleic-acid-binding protein
VSKKSPYYFIDTNIFLRVLIRDNEKKFSDVTTFLEGIRNNLYPAYTSSFVLAELVWILSSYYKLNKADVVKAAESILNLNGLSFVENHDSSEALSLYKKYNVKFVDCLI